MARFSIVWQIYSALYKLYIYYNINLSKYFKSQITYFFRVFELGCLGSRLICYLYGNCMLVQYGYKLNISYTIITLCFYITNWQYLYYKCLGYKLHNMFSTYLRDDSNISYM